VNSEVLIVNSEMFTVHYEHFTVHISLFTVHNVVNISVVHVTKVCYVTAYFCSVQIQTFENRCALLEWAASSDSSSWAEDTVDLIG
jgi:hypothetical protein